MKYFRLFSVFILLFSFSLVYGGSPYSTIRQFKDGLLGNLKIANNSNLYTDTAMYRICKEALSWTSIDIGGFESTVRFVTVANQAFYTLPDTVTEILFATLLSTDLKVTKDLRAFHTEFVEDKYDLNTLDGIEADQDATPKVYNVWANQIQLIPTPVREDSIILKVYLEHPMPNGSDSTIKLASGFIEASMQIAMAKAKEYLGLYDEATYYERKYDKAKATLIEQRRMRYGLGFSPSEN